MAFKRIMFLFPFESSHVVSFLISSGTVILADKFLYQSFTIIFEAALSVDVCHTECVVVAILKLGSMF